MSSQNYRLYLAKQHAHTIPEGNHFLVCYFIQQYLHTFDSRSVDLLVCLMTCKTCHVSASCVFYMEVVLSF